MKGIETWKGTRSKKEKEGKEMRTRTMKLGLSLGCIVAVLFLVSSLAAAFHSAAELVCNKCHTMHYSEDDAAPDMPDVNTDLTGLTQIGPNKQLLYYSNVTDLCLACHSGATGQAIGSETAWSVYGKTTDTPGGDFDASDGTGNTGKGHNPYGNDTRSSGVIDADEVAGIKLTPPGGGGASLTEWSCTSCHGPHGGSAESIAYRNLKKTVNGVDVSGTIGSGDSEEADLSAAYGAANHNVYWNGAETGPATKFGAWCAACHGTFHGDENDTDIQDAGGDWIRHPTAYDVGATLGGNYGATYDPAYPLVEDSGHGWTTGAAGTVSSDEEVFCLTCHQAHASSYTNMTRWDSGAAAGANAHCNKCHKKGS